MRIGLGKGVRIISVIGVPSSLRGTPAARCAPQGAKMSRPWKVWLTFFSQNWGWSRQTIWIDSPAASASSSRGVSRPLSGAIKNWLPKRAPMARRSVPTPGSITAMCTEPEGKNGTARHSAMAPWRTSCGGISWEISAICASGAILQMTPFIVPTKPFKFPKSVVREITAML